MSVKYMKFSISIHGLDVEDAVIIKHIKSCLREATKNVLLGDMKKYFNFRNEFESDIEVEFEELAGKFSMKSNCVNP